jgi:hypothetical protein
MENDDRQSGSNFFQWIGFTQRYGSHQVINFPGLNRWFPEWTLDL